MQQRAGSWSGRTSQPGACCAGRPAFPRIGAQCPNRNQLRLTNSPPDPVNVITTVCTPVTELVRLVVTLPQVCQPPVLLIGTLAITVPVALSSRYCTVPVKLAPEARRVMTWRAAVVPKLMLA